MKIVCISDTHGYQPKLPEGDVLVHCGDFSGAGTHKEMIDHITWIKSLANEYEAIICTLGNHERFGEQNLGIAKQMFKDAGAVLLIDEGYEFGGKKFYGTPWTPMFYNWAFMDSEAALANKFLGIPEGLDMLISHGPPLGILDLVQNGTANAGSTALLDRVFQVKPKNHVFGHLHSNGVNAKVVGDTNFVNCSYLDDGYQKNGHGIYICKL
jgi:Icc-related predicted phosphoesterase